MELLKINENNKDAILDLFRKEIDANGFIIEKKTKKKLICPYSKEPIKSDNFSIVPGTATFINNYPYCFTEHLTKHR